MKKFHLISIMLLFVLSGCDYSDYLFFKQKTATDSSQDTSQNIVSQHANTCEVVGITDGDTFTCLYRNNNNQQIKVRLAEIDAPESSQPYGQKSKEKLSDFIYRKTVRLENTSIDKYGRTLAVVRDATGENINLQMVRAGMAWAYTQYSTNPIYSNAQSEAKDNKRGLWAGSQKPIYPSDWRRGKRDASTSSVTTDSTANHTSRSTRQRTKSTLKAQPSNGKFSCGGKTVCGQMSSCAEARFYLNKCGLSRLDRDHDGIPCESICR